MPKTDWVPRRVLEFAELVKVWATWLPDTEKQAAFGWDPALCATTAATLNAFLAAQEGYETDKTPEKKLTRDEAWDAADTAMRDFTNASVHYNKKMTDAQKAHLGIHIKDSTPTTVDVPQTRPVIAEA